MPQRIQLRRTKGWRKSEGVIVVSRPSKWANPFPVLNGDRGRAVAAFRQWLTDDRHESMRVQLRIDLAGHDLACWCPLDQPCHADILLEIANS